MDKTFSLIALKQQAMHKIFAQLLGIDEILAKKCAFFHDIGKVIDFDTNLDHVDAGVLLAKNLDCVMRL